MFSPIGKKKILLQQKFGESPPRSPSPVGDRTAVSSGSGIVGTRELKNKLKVLAPTSAVAASNKLEAALSDVGLLGIAMRRIMEATARYRSDRDGVLLKAFESKTLEYNFLRQNLHSVFWLVFSDEEFSLLIDYFDPTHAGIVDGYSFMKAFVRLSGIRKSRESLEVREKQESFEQNIKDQEERERLSKNKMLEQGIDYHFSAGIRERAISKLRTAAGKFDPGHPAAPSTRSFNINFVKPATFREMIKLTFNLKLDPKELGAVVKEFNSEVEKDIPASEFLKYFLRLGIEIRDEQRAEQRKKQELLNKQAAEERQKKLEEKNKKLKTHVDFNFSDEDELRVIDKLRVSSEKYDKSGPGSVALDGFECEELSPLDFKELVRRVFNLPLSPTELGYLIQKYDVKKSGNIHCKTFLIEFLALGHEIRHENHIKQLEKQRRLNEQTEKEHLEKIAAVQKSEKVSFSDEYTDEDLQSALAKLANAAKFFDKERSGGFKSFEVESVNMVQFKRGVKRTFNIDFSAQEMGAVWNYLQKNDKDEVICYDFINTFISLGVNERDRFRLEQLERQRLANQQAQEEHERKVQAQQSKILYEVEYEFDPHELESAMVKMIVAAKKYDAGHPAALSLQGFEVKTLSGPQFKELVRRTFQLNLAAREVGAIFKYFSDRTPYGKSKPPFDQIDCADFLTFFLQLGIKERAKVHVAQLERQRREDKEREEEHERKILETATRGTYKPDMDFSKEDQESILEKLKIAAEKFDRNHPASPSLEAFEVSHMMPGVFRENIKNIFGVRATPKEIGYLLQVYDKDKSQRISVREFLIKFFQQGQEIRDEKKRQVLLQQRESQKAAKEEQIAKLTQLIEKSDFQLDHDYTTEDYREAVRRMTLSSEKYDKTHPSAPNLDGFTGGPLAPGAFRELMKRAFGIYLTAKEVTSILDRYHVENNKKMLDGKKFLIMFMRLGQEARSRLRTQQLAEQRKFQMERIQEQERKLRMALRRVELDADAEFTDADRESALNKLVEAAALYDKNAPGCVSLDAFNAKYLTPGVFRETLKKTFNMVVTGQELSALLAEFDNGSGNVDSQKFVVQCIKMGQDERQKRKLIQLEKQRAMDTIREQIEVQKKKEQEMKNNLKVSYKYTPQEREEAFRKLAFVAKKFDKAHPAAMSLDGFEEKYLKPNVFREMLKRTFNFVPSPAELGAIVHYFDQANTGQVSSKKFLIHFIKLGIAQRDIEHKESLRKLAEDAEFRERFHLEKMAAQWAKAELNISFNFTPKEKESALEKLAIAASKFDPASPGPMGLTAFEAKVLSPAVFREMLKRCFNLFVSNGELAAIISEFEDKSQFVGQHMINCKDFLVRFNAMGFQIRDQFRLAQLEKQRQLDGAYEQERKEKQQALDTKKDINLDTVTFSNNDFRSALEKIRVVAANYDRSHPSAPSLKGFEGTDMKPNEFKDMLMRTFQLKVTLEELAAIVAYFPAEHKAKKSKRRSASRDEDDDEEDESATRASRSKSASVAPPKHEPRVNNKEFLNHFNKIQREEQTKRNHERIQRERDLIQQEKNKKKQLAEDVALDLENRLRFTPEDEESCLQKMKSAARDYAIDSAPYIDLLQGFKGPALPPDKFRELFYNIFAVRFSFAELGVLLSILDHSNLRVFDGPRFLNFFYKISRIEEKFMLHESTQEVTLDTLRSVGQKPSLQQTAKTALLSTSSSVNSEKHTKAKTAPKTAATSKTMPSTAGLDSLSFSARIDSPSESSSKRHLSSAHVEEEASFTKSTLSHSWLLPSITASEPSQLDEMNAFLNGDFMNSASLHERDRLATATQEMRDHLKSLFESDRLDDERAFSSTSNHLWDDEISQLQSLDGSLSEWNHPSQVIDFVQELEKNRFSVHTAPAKTRADSARNGKAPSSNFKKCKSSPFILVPTSSRSSNRSSRTADGGNNATMSTISEVHVAEQPAAAADVAAIEDSQRPPSSAVSMNDSSQWTAALDNDEPEAPQGEFSTANEGEVNYLQSLFSSLSAITDGTAAVNSRKMVHAKDPISQLKRLQKHFHDSPMSAMASKEREVQKRYRMKKNARTLAPIEPPKPKPPKSETKKPDKTDGGGFFFPVLLNADVSNLQDSLKQEEVQDFSAGDEEDENGVKAPNIDIVGRMGTSTDATSYDLEFLKELLQKPE